MDQSVIIQEIEVAVKVVAAGAISANAHGNVSLRGPESEEMYFTSGHSLRNHPPELVARLGLDGVVREGRLPPIQGAVVAMHTAIYGVRPDVGWVIHTHSLCATALAVAQWPIE